MNIVVLYYYCILYRLRRCILSSLRKAFSFFVVVIHYTACLSALKRLKLAHSPVLICGAFLAYCTPTKEVQAASLPDGLVFLWFKIGAGVELVKAGSAAVRTLRVSWLAENSFE